MIGTEKHESRRIDEQLRGRSGRQGEVGESIFYISLEDELLKIYGNKKKIERYKKKYDKRKRSKEIKNIFINQEIKKAQRRAENRAYSIRRRLVYYDDILSIQRKIIYSNRKEIIKNKEEIIKSFIAYFCNYIIDNRNENTNKIIKILEKSEKIHINRNTINKLKKRIYAKYIEKKKKIGNKKFKQIETNRMIHVIDKNWICHMDKLENIRQGIELQMYGRYNPIQKYNVIAKLEFDKLVEKIKLDIVSQLLFSKDFE